MTTTYPVIFIYIIKQLGLIELVKEKITHRAEQGPGRSNIVHNKGCSTMGIINPDYLNGSSIITFDDSLPEVGKPFQTGVQYLQLRVTDGAVVIHLDRH